MQICMAVDVNSNSINIAELQFDKMPKALFYSVTNGTAFSSVDLSMGCIFQ